MRVGIDQLVLAKEATNEITLSRRAGGALEPFSHQELEHRSSVVSYGEAVLPTVVVAFDLPIKACRANQRGRYSLR